MSRDARALAKMFERLEGPLFRKCLAMLKDHDLARDATQELFVKLSASADTLRDPEAELAWALQAAHHHCLNVLRAQQRREAREARDPGEDLAHSPVTNRQLGRAVLEGLSETSRALVVGNLVEEEDHASLARRHGVSKKTVSRKLKAAVEAARAKLKRGGHS
ncbi:MAG: RNA polymerase sigma factor [Myxococcota bacterium]